MKCSDRVTYVLISRRICILALILVFSFCILGYCAGQLWYSISISSLGGISLKRGYICGNYNSTHYYAQNNVTNNYELMSTSASQTIYYAITHLTSGRTWQEAVRLNGSFLIDSTIEVASANLLLDCREADITLTAAMALEIKAENVTILGGHWTGTVAMYDGIRFVTSGARNCMIDGADFENFEVAMQVASSQIVIQNCNFHDMTANDYFVVCNGDGRNIIRNCTFLYAYHPGGADPGGGIFIAPSSGYNLIENCEFGYLHAHSIYSDGGSTSVGHNEIAGCKFHDFLGGNGAALHIKSQNNKIHDNEFWNWPTSYTVSIYSELATYRANDNEVYHNNFKNCLIALVVGHSTSGYNATNRTLIHDNVFRDCYRGIVLSAGNSPAFVGDTKIYYNDFHNVTYPITSFSYDVDGNVVNTVLAYNYLDVNVPSLPLWTNTMSYQNTDFPPNTNTLRISNFNYDNITDPSSWYHVAPRT